MKSINKIVFFNSQASNHDEWKHRIAVARWRCKYHKAVKSVQCVWIQRSLPYSSARMDTVSATTANEGCQAAPHAGERWSTPGTSSLSNLLTRWCTLATTAHGAAIRCPLRNWRNMKLFVRTGYTNALWLKRMVVRGQDAVRIYSITRYRNTTNTFTDQTFVPSYTKSLIFFKNANFHAYFLLVGKHSGSGQNVILRTERCMKLCRI
jgi:hypothetical protein